MNLDIKTYNRQYLTAHQVVLEGDQRNNHPFEKYGAHLVEADVPPGTTYWKVIGVHHLLPKENRGANHTYVEVLNEAGQRPHKPIVWADHQMGEVHEPMPLDKPLNEPAGNFPMYKGRHKVKIRGAARNANEPSDLVEFLHTDHPDEPLPLDGQGGNTRYHHSFYIVFQHACKENGGEVLDFEQYALAHDLGTAVTPKFQFQGYHLQAFTQAVVFALLDQPAAIRHQRWP